MPLKRRRILGIILLLVLLASLARAQAQVYPGASWATATPAEQNFDPDLFAAALATLPDKSIVIRRGFQVGTKGSVSTTGLTWSASKSFVALLFGKQLQLGNVTYDDTVPNSDNPSAPLATFRQFMSMTSDYGLSPHAPGDHFGYNNASTHHYGTHLKETFWPGLTHVQTLESAFVTALDFEDALGYNTAGFMSGWDGGWSMSTRDAARIGYLVLRGGNWSGTQIVPSTFIDALYICQIPDEATQTTDEDDQFFNQQHLSVQMPNAYSFGFWLPQHTSVFDSASTAEWISMSGAFGTSIHISRDLDMVVAAVNTGGTTTNPGPRITGAMLDAITAAITDLPTSRGMRGKSSLKGKGTIK